jgi:hypothetical protein
LASSCTCAFTVASFFIPHKFQGQICLQQQLQRLLMMMMKIVKERYITTCIRRPMVLCRALHDNGALLWQ